MGMTRMSDEEGVVFLEICKKCHKHIVFMDEECINCYVPDFPDLALIYEDK